MQNTSPDLETLASSFCSQVACVRLLRTRTTMNDLRFREIVPAIMNQGSPCSGLTRGHCVRAARRSKPSRANWPVRPQNGFACIVKDQNLSNEFRMVFIIYCHVSLEWELRLILIGLYLQENSGWHLDAICRSEMQEQVRCRELELTSRCCSFYPNLTNETSLGTCRSWAWKTKFKQDRREDQR